MAKFYQVGGCVRDRLLGIQSKDIDFSVEAASYDAMREAVIARGCEVKVDKPEFVTIRAVHPELGGVDFVLCRKDGTYENDGRRPDFVEIGTLSDDLARRDFTVNAMAEAEDGSLIDPHGGQIDLAARVLRCVGDTDKRLREDSLRMLRAIRFAITKGFHLSCEIKHFLHGYARLLDNISIERIREELLKCFEKDTLLTLQYLEDFKEIRREIFKRNLKLTPTIFVRK